MDHPENEHASAASRLDAAYVAVSARTGYRPETVQLVHQVFWHAAELARRAAPREVETPSLTAKAICHGLLDVLNAQYDGSLEDTLTAFGIAGSEDVGRIVERLIAEGVMAREHGDRPERFHDLFKTDSLAAALADFGIERRPRARKNLLQRLPWLLYFAGAGILIVSHEGLVDAEIGRFGWWICTAGCMLHYFGATRR